MAVTLRRQVRTACTQLLLDTAETSQLSLCTRRRAWGAICGHGGGRVLRHVCRVGGADRGAAVGGDKRAARGPRMPAVLAAGQEERADRGGLHLKAALMGLVIRAFAASCCLLLCASLHCVDPACSVFCSSVSAF